MAKKHENVNLMKKINLNPFSTNVPLLCFLKTSENRSFSHVFRGYRSGTLVENRLLLILTFRFNDSVIQLNKKVTNLFKPLGSIKQSCNVYEKLPNQNTVMLKY